MFAPLPLATVEHLTRNLQERSYAPGDFVLREGDEGENFHVIVSGSAKVSQNGEPIRRLERGDGFGEIALLKTARRTASVRALDPLTTYAISSRSFVTAVSGFSTSASAAELAIATRLAEDTSRTLPSEASSTPDGDPPRASQPV